MPTYDYHCAKNQRTVSVQHSMKEKLASWGELCQKIQQDPGDTPLDSPIERVISGGIALPIASAIPQLPMAGCCGNPTGCGQHH